jgi:hypothetical protein
MLRLLAGLLLLAACASAPARTVETTRCPESRALFCLTAPECSFDRERGCLVCLCSSSQAPPSRPVDANVPAAR